jgi:hypothetical protein
MRGTPAGSKLGVGSLCSPYPSHRRQSFRHPERNPTRFEKGKPERLGRREAGCETPIKVGRSDARRSLKREGQTGEYEGPFC